MELEQHRAGELAYLDSFAGLVPCRVLKVLEPAPAPNYEIGVHDIEIKVTATRGAYKRGEIIGARSLNIVPRTSVRVRSGQYRIRNNYQWIASS